MKNKAVLSLIELSVMLLVFAVASVLCTRAFLWAKETSETCSARDQALLQAQNAAETLKTCGSDMERATDLLGGGLSAGVWSIHYNEQWEQTDGPGTYLLTAALTESGSPLLGTAEVQVLRGDTCLIRLETAWQEVVPHA